MQTKITQLKKIKDEIVALRESPLYEYRVQNNNVPAIGEGSYDARIMFIGEAPGKNEAKTGKPFCGASGRILDELLASAKLKREDVYITNIVNDRPPENRDPSPKEIELYGPFLERQINVIGPKIIATLGRFSMKYIMEKFGLESQLDTIGKIHGKVFEIDLPYGKVKIIPLYHPAVVVYNAKTKDELKKDFRMLVR